MIEPKLAGVLTGVEYPCYSIRTARTQVLSLVGFPFTVFREKLTLELSSLNNFPSASPLYAPVPGL